MLASLRAPEGGGNSFGMGRLGAGELLLIALLALILFGGGRIADIGRGLGEGIKNFKKGLREAQDDEKPIDVTTKPKTEPSEPEKNA